MLKKWGIRLSRFIIFSMVLSMFSFYTRVPNNALALNGDSSVKYGDVNGDGKVNILDYLLMKRYISNTINKFPSSNGVIAADVNGDGKIDLEDYVLVRKYILRSIKQFPVEVSPITSNAIFVSPSGKDSADGTVNNPTTFVSALTKVSAGETIYMIPGTYSYSSQITINKGNDGTTDKPKKIMTYGTGRVVLDFSSETYVDPSSGSNPRGLQVNGNYWYIKGLNVTGAADNGIYIGGSNDKIELCETYSNRDAGFQLGRYAPTALDSEWPSNNSILNCTSYDNADPDNGEDADGFACKLTTGTGNVFDGCISHNNVDDGWDLYTKSATGAIGPVIIKNCVAYNNGVTSNGTCTANSDGNGFKLGGDKIAVNHIVTNCLSFNNKKHGFTYNSNPGSITLTNCTGYNNGTTSGSNFAFDIGTHVFTNLLSYKATSSDKLGSGTDVQNSNVWWVEKKSKNGKGLTCSDTDFVSLTQNITRNADGSVNLGDFLKLAKGSKLIGAGTPSGTDIGVLRSGNTSEPTNPVSYPIPILTASTTAANVSSVTVTISSYGNAPIKKYKIDNGLWKDYTGSIVVNSNCTIYAQGSDSQGNISSIGSLVISNIGGTTITYLTPTLTPDTKAANASSVTVTIGNFGTATIKQYKIDNGSWQNYTVPVIIKSNCTIYAEGSDSNGNKSAIGSLAINNIGSTPIGKVITVTDFNGLKSAVDSSTNGQTIEIAANVLDCTSQIALSRVDSNITIQAAEGYTPVLDFTSFREASKKSSPTKTGDGFVGVRITGGKYTIKGLIIQKAYDNGMLIKPNYNPNTPITQLAAGKPDDNTIVDCVFCYNGDAGLQVSGSQSLEEAGVHVRPNNNHVIGCVSYRNFDILTTGGNADGFAAKLYLGTGTVFSHCVSAENSDDAWDSFGIANSDVTYEYCVAYHSGDASVFNGNYDSKNGLPVDTNMTTGACSGNGNGFKMGSGSSKYGAKTDGTRNLTNCVSVDNMAKGFDENNGAGTINLTNGMGLGNLKGDYVLNLMTAGTFTNAQAFSAKSLKNPVSGNVSIVDTSKQAAIRLEINSAIAKMRQELNENKIPSYMNFSFWTETPTPPTTVTYPSPVLTATTAADASSVTVTIGNFGTASIKQYKIDNGSWQNYTVPVVIKSNCTIYAEGSDSDGNKSAIESLVINNIGAVTPPVPPAGSNTIYVGGTDGVTLSQAIKTVKDKDTIMVRGTITSGSVTIPSGVTLTGETGAKINFAGANKGISISGTGVTISNLDIYGAGDNGIYITGSKNNILNCIVHDNEDAGVQLCNGAAGNFLQYVYSHHNADASGGNADGFACKLHAGEGNVFDHCTSEYNSDDGFDLYAAHGAVTFISCKANYNGECYGKTGNGSGFKVGGVDNKTSGVAAHLDPLKHVLTDCTAEGNKVGFDRNNQNGIVTMTRCTSKSNTVANYKFLLTGTPSALGYQVTFGIANIDSCTSINGSNDISGATLIGTCIGFN